MKLADAIEKYKGEATVFITQDQQSYLVMNSAGELFPFWNDGLGDMPFLEILVDVDSPTKPYMSQALDMYPPEFHDVEVVMIKGFDSSND